MIGFDSTDALGRRDQAIVWADHLRRPLRAPTATGRHKEWLHFVIQAEGLDFLVNFSLVDDSRAEATGPGELARLVVLSRDGAWDGDIELFDADEIQVRGGDVSMRFGDNVAEYRDGLFYLRVRMRNRPVSADLVLIPEVIPAPCNNIRFGMDKAPINWMVLPRLRASGTVSINGKTRRLEDVPAYHDHNWGDFGWGEDFAWEWGFALPEKLATPWSLVYVRLSNRSRTRVFKQGLFVWHGPTVARVWRGSQMTVDLEDRLAPADLFKLPGVMNVIDPGSAADVPHRLRCRAEGGGDCVELEFDSEDVAQVCIPNDTDDHGITIINEVAGRLRASGTVGGRPLALDGAGVFEFIRGAE